MTHGETQNQSWPGYGGGSVLFSPSSSTSKIDGAGP